ncbi:MAG: ATP-dependent DNA helicase [Ruminococcaceae bacterium]|nr:ATP-dependent DNA helicase [Oscillospiraceae bacterium]
MRVKYSFEYDHIEINADELCLNIFGRSDLDISLIKEYNTAKKLKRAYSPKLASDMGGEYYMNVALCNTSKLDDIYYCVSGECDGIIKRNSSYTVVEISVNGKRDIPLISRDFYTARLYLMAYFVCCQKDLDAVEICMVSYNTELGKTSEQRDSISREELRNSYMKMLGAVHRRAGFIVASKRERIPMLSDAVFPYRELRESQAEMIRECYRDIKHGNRLFCQAPTGIGKTISTLYPAVKCIGEGVADKIFYLTSKNSIRREALSAATNMREHGSKIYTCVLSSKEQMCACEAAKLAKGRLSSYCRAETCPYAKGYYDRAENAIFDLISHGFEFDREDIRRAALKHRVCPHELSLDLSELCDIIICDYNYVFSPSVYLKRYFANDGREEKYIFLVDEAHNLPDRARDLFSAKLCVSDFETVAQSLSENSSLMSEIGSVMSELENLSVLCNDNLKYDAEHNKVGYYVGKQLPQKLSEKLTACGKAIERWMKYNSDSPAYSFLDELYSKIREYKIAEECFGDKFLVFISTCGDNTEILLYCLDPSELLDASLNRAVASVLFSATLTPAEYFADILGGGKKGVAVSFPSPFDRDHLCVAAVDTISTRYEDRERSYKKIASCVAATASAKAGNYIVFLPSYSYMESVAKAFTDKYPKVRVKIQERGMSYKDREDFLAFFEDDKKLRIGFCVMGGLFSEGIDLPGNRLIGVVVVGVGLPGISNERNIMRDYYDEKCGEGYDYAYTYPGMNGVLQAVGRVIRRDEDRGIAVLIDDRYSEPKYINLFPQEWKNIKFAGNSVSLAEIARKFWEKQG